MIFLASRLRRFKKSGSFEEPIKLHNSIHLSHVRYRRISNTYVLFTNWEVVKIIIMIMITIIIRFKELIRKGATTITTKN